ncbi:18160_t:CDS:2, partial [Dentiscutata erythropus]
MGIGLIISYLYFAYESPRARDRNLVNVFKKGKICREINLPLSKKLFKREKLENDLKKTLQLPLPLNNYFLILGEHGTGKTTLVQNTILNLQEPKGVAYFECPLNVKDFAKNLSKHLDCELYPFKLRDVIVQWITRKVLILDQVDRIAKDDPKFLGILQDFAKDCADKGSIVVVFIASEGISPQIMKCSDAM